MPDILTPKQKQFNAAMERFEKKPGYIWFGRLVSTVNVGLQAVMVFLVIPQSIGWASQIVTFAAAYILADFVNGLVHMYMDNNDSYESLVGPLVASFHLHHRTPVYKTNPLYVVYFHETGSKVWLALFMIIAVSCVLLGIVTGVAVWGILYFSVLSSVAEISHYLCHVEPTRIAKFLGMTVLMSRRHHAPHHIEDNRDYAFLNGMTDPVLNIIAKAFFPGYKKNTDTHYAYYKGTDTSNRG